jgi:hypothetical protein
MARGSGTSSEGAGNAAGDAVPEGVPSTSTSRRRGFRRSPRCYAVVAVEFRGSRGSSGSDTRWKVPKRRSQIVKTTETFVGFLLAWWRWWPSAVANSQSYTGSR